MSAVYKKKFQKVFNVYICSYSRVLNEVLIALVKGVLECAKNLILSACFTCCWKKKNVTSIALGNVVYSKASECCYVSTIWDKNMSAKFY